MQKLHGTCLKNSQHFLHEISCVRSIVPKNLMDFSMGSLAFWAIGFGIMFKLIDKTVGLRVSPEEEMEGLDFAEHGGNAYPDFEVSSSYGGVGSSMGPGSPSTTGDTVGQFEPVEQT
jgi:Amt family ammonium transporter